MPFFPLCFFFLFSFSLPALSLSRSLSLSLAFRFFISPIERDKKTSLLFNV